MEPTMFNIEHDAAKGVMNNIGDGINWVSESGLISERGATMALAMAAGTAPFAVVSNTNPLSIGGHALVAGIAGAGGYLSGVAMDGYDAFLNKDSPTYSLGDGSPGILQQFADAYKTLTGFGVSPSVAEPEPEPAPEKPAMKIGGAIDQVPEIDKAALDFSLQIPNTQHPEASPAPGTVPIPKRKPEEREESRNDGGDGESYSVDNPYSIVHNSPLALDVYEKEENDGAWFDGLGGGSSNDSNQDPSESEESGLSDHYGHYGLY